MMRYINFVDAAKEWHYREIVRVDEGLAKLQNATENTSLLKFSGKSITLKRKETPIDDRTLAINRLNGTIDIFDKAFTSSFSVSEDDHS